MALSAEQLHTLAFSVTPDVIKSYPHMIDVWKALLGGYVLPEMARAEPESIAGNKEFEALIAEYTKEKIVEMFSKGEDRIVEVIKEIPVITEKTVIIREVEHIVHRRLKSDVKKIKRKKRPMVAHERDLIIKVFNDRQDMLDKTSETCKNLVTAINEGRKAEDKISAPQLAGYWSSLCRWANSTRPQRDNWIKRSLKKDVFSVTPVYSEAFVAKIKANSEVRKREAKERAIDHSRIKATGERRKILISEAVPAGPLPGAVPAGPLPGAVPAGPLPGAILDLTDII